MYRPVRLFILTVALTAAIAPPRAVAQGTYTWTGGGTTFNQNWSNPSNWTVTGGNNPPVFNGTAAAINFTAAVASTAPNQDIGQYFTNQLNLANADYTLSGFNTSNPLVFITSAGPINPTISLTTANTVTATATQRFLANAPLTIDIAAGGLLDVQNLDASSSSFGLTKTGAGTLRVSSASSFSYGAPVTIQSGILALTTNPGFIANGTTINAGALLNLSSGFVSTGTLIGAGNITLGVATLNLGSSTAYSGSISGLGIVRAQGTLTGTNTHQGGTSTFGTVTVGSDAALGAATVPLDFSNGGTLRFSAAATIARPIVSPSATINVDTNGFNAQLSGPVNGFSLTKSGAGTLTLNAAGSQYGTVTASAGTIAVNHPLALQYASVSPATGIDLNGLPAATFGFLSGAANLNLGVTNLTMRGMGTFSGVISGTGGLTIDALFNGGSAAPSASQSYSGQTTVLNGGTMSLAGATAAIPSSTAVAVGALSTLTLGDTSTGNNGDRLNNAAPLTLSGGTVNLVSTNVAGGTSETLASVALAGGPNTIALTANATGQTQLVATGALTRSNRATLTVAGANLGLAAGANNTNLKFGSAPAGLSGGGGVDGTTTINILPYAIGGASGSAELLTFNATNGLRPLNTATEHATTIADGTATFANVRLTTGATVNSAATEINALAVKSGGSVGGTGTLKVRSGAVLLNGGTVGVSTLDFGAIEGVIHAASSSTISSNITGTNGVTFGGGGQISLSAMNGYSGGTTVNGSLFIANDGNLGAGTLTLNNGQLVTGAATTLLHSVAVEGSGMLVGNTSLDVQGAISGSGRIRTNGIVTLSNSGNSHAGGTEIFFNTLNVGSDGALGAAGAPLTVSQNGGTLKPTASFTIARPVRLFNFTNNFTVDTNGQTLTMSGAIGGQGVFMKSGAGALHLTGENGFHSPSGISAMVTAGTLGIASDASLGLPQSVYMYGSTTLKALADLQTSPNRTITMTVSTAGTATFDTNGFSMALYGPLQYSTTLTTLIKTGPGTLSLLNTNNNFYAQNGIAVAGGLLQFGGDFHLGNSSNTLTLNGGGLKAGGDLRTTRSITIGSGGATFDTGGYTMTLAGTVTGTGPLTKSGAGELVPPANRTWIGTTVTGGLLQFPTGTLPAGNFVVSGGQLRLNAPTNILHSASVSVGAAGTAAYSGTVIGGFLRGTGTHSLASGTTLSGSTVGSDVTLAQTAPATFANVSHSGTLTNAAALTWDGGGVTASGRMTVNNTVTVSAFESTGVVTIPAGGMIVNAPIGTGSTSIVLGGGSTTFVGSVATPGGIINVGTSPMLVRGGLLVNNGAIGNNTGTGQVIVDYGGKAKGAGYFDNAPLTQNGGVFSPGNSPGRVQVGGFTMNPGGMYEFEINNATGTPGPTGAGPYSGWDLTDITNQFNAANSNLNMTATPGMPFTIQLRTLTNPSPPDIAGNMANFDPTQTYQWLAFDVNMAASNPFPNGFDPNAIVIDRTNFTNFAGGMFSMQRMGNQVFLQYSPVPEPVAVLGVLLVGAGAVAWRRRKCQEAHGRTDAFRHARIRGQPPLRLSRESRRAHPHRTLPRWLNL